MKKLAIFAMAAAAIGAQAVPVHAQQMNNNGVVWWQYAASSITIQSQPTAADLSYYAPPVQNQDPNNIGLNSCSAWTSGEDHYWLAYFDYGNQYSPGFAPMYTYTRLNGHQSSTTTAVTDNFYYMVHDGQDTINEYPSLSANENVWDAKYNYYQTPAITSNHKLYSYGRIYNDSGSKFVSELKELINYAYPAVLVVPYYNDIAHVTAPSYLVNGPTSDRTANSAHAVLASKYDSAGVWFQNTYGTVYGKSGWAELSWSYVSTYVTDLFWAWDARGSNVFELNGQTTPASLPMNTALTSAGATSSPAEPTLGGRGISDDGVTSARAALPGTPPGDPRFGGRDLRPDEQNAQNTFTTGPPLGPRPLVMVHR